MMGDWEELTNAHGYDANDPDALDNMLSDWEFDEEAYVKKHEPKEYVVYELLIRRFNKADVSRDCPFIMEEEEVNSQIEPFIEDFKTIDGIDDLVLEDIPHLDKMHITIKSNLSKEDLRSRMKPCFSDYFCYFRHISLNQQDK